MTAAASPRTTRLRATSCVLVSRCFCGAADTPQHGPILPQSSTRGAIRIWGFGCSRNTPGRQLDCLALRAGGLRWDCMCTFERAVELHSSVSLVDDAPAKPRQIGRGEPAKFLSLAVARGLALPC